MLLLVTKTFGGNVKRGAKAKRYRLNDGKYVTIEDVMMGTGLSHKCARSRLEKSNDANNVFREVLCRRIPNISKLRILMGRPFYDPMFILAMKKI